MPATSLLVLVMMTMMMIMIANKKTSRTTNIIAPSVVPTVNAFTVSTKHISGQQQRKSSPSPLCATTSSSTATNNKPKRLTQNVDGVVYVNDRCIDCAACAGFADNIFRHDRNADAHVVYQQPQTSLDIAMTRAALAACPVAAIRIETLAERRHRAAVNKIQSSKMEIHETTDKAKNQFDIEWDEQDIWTVQQMTSKENKRPFPRPFLLFNDTDLAVTDSSLSTTTTTTKTTTKTSTHTTAAAVPDVYWVGHHNERSFGAIPYLLKARHNNNDNVWIMVDVPKFNVQAVRDVTSITGPNGPHYLFMTHVDDTADHLLWAEYFNSTTTKFCQRIIHASDLGRYNWIGDTSLEHVPILLQEPSKSKHRNGALVAYTLDGTYIDNENWVHDFENGLLLNNTDVVIVHTPGHSPGSCTLYKRRTVPSNTSTTPAISSSPGILFTGDTYAYSRTNSRMTGFPRYGRNMQLLNTTLHSLVYELNAWDIIAPGHGTSRDYRTVGKDIMYQELQQAQHDLFAYQRR